MLRSNLKRHYHLIVLLALLAIGLIVGMGDQRIVAYTVRIPTASQDVLLAHVVEWFNVFAP